MRMCRYASVTTANTGARPSTSDATAAGGGGDQVVDCGDDTVVVAFAEHTDTTFVTVGVVSDQPGLELLVDEEAGWLAVERKHEPLRDMVVIVGEYLHLLTKGAFAATRHRVVFPRATAAGHGCARFSSPLLIRGHGKQRLWTTPPRPPPPPAPQLLSPMTLHNSGPTTGGRGAPAGAAPAPRNAPSFPPCELLQCRGTRLHTLHVRRRLLRTRVGGGQICQTRR
jgi:isopenicillin N synthase-like dioxygenase